MLCDGCNKREASVMLHMITNGQVTTRSLCLQCARKAHGEMSQAFSTMGMQLEALQGLAEQPQEEKLRLPEMICSTCRTPYERIDHDTVFGCASCYQAFHDKVIGFLSGVRGKQEEDKPAEGGQPVRIPLPTVEELKARIADALSVEDYEQAAELRDQLRRAARPQEGMDA